MNFKKGLFFLFFLTILPAGLYSQTPTALAVSSALKLTGHIGKEPFLVGVRTTKNDPDNNNVDILIRFRGKLKEIKYPGYVIGNLKIEDINDDGNDEILFLYYQGADLYDMGLIEYKGGDFRDLDMDAYAGRNFEMLKYKNKPLLEMELEDKDGHGNSNFYVSDLVELQGDKLLPVKSVEAWEEVIRDKYLGKLKSLKADDDRSRVYSYIYMAYKGIGLNDKAKEYHDKAEKLDPKNPFLE